MIWPSQSLMPPMRASLFSRLGECAGSPPQHEIEAGASTPIGARGTVGVGRHKKIHSLGHDPDCGGPATVPDHDPVSRAELVRQGVPDPDDWRYLRPRCERCHNKKTATRDGGFGR
jgi:hypothetical protein